MRYYESFDVLPEREYSQTPAEILEIPKTEMSTGILDQLLSERDTPFFHCGPLTIDTIIDWITRLLSYFLSLAAIALFALSLNESRAPLGWVMAAAAGIANMAQMIETDQETIRRHFDYLKFFGKAIKEQCNGEPGFRKLLGYPSHYLMSIRNITRFFIRDLGFKWFILYNVSMLLPSLITEEVSWLNFPFFVTYLHIAFMFLLESSVHTRLQNIELPKLTVSQIVEAEIAKLRTTLTLILQQNAADACSEIDERFIEAINNRNEHYVMSKLFSHCGGQIKHAEANLPRLLGAACAMVLTIIYIASNAGGYRATWHNANAPLQSKISSMFGDMLFGLFMAIRAGMPLAYFLLSLLKVLRRHCNVIRDEWRNILLCVFGLLVSGFTVNSTLAANTAACMPIWIWLPGIAGTIFDNFYFLIELLISKEIAHTVRAPGEDSPKRNSPHHKKALITRLYEIAQAEYDKLSDQAFIASLIAQIENDPNILNDYQELFAKRFPWSVGLKTASGFTGAPAIIQTLALPAGEAIHYIDRSRRFGPRRHREEFIGSLVTAAIASTTIFIRDPAYLRLYISPALAVPAGLGVVGLLSCYHEQRQRRHRRGESQPLVVIVDAENPHPTAHTLSITPLKDSRCIRWIYTALQIILSMGLPILVQWFTTKLLHWIWLNIFDQAACSPATPTITPYNGTRLFTATPITTPTPYPNPGPSCLPLAPCYPLPISPETAAGIATTIGTAVLMQTLAGWSR